MNIETPPTPSPREQASLLVNNYARKSAALEAATASIRAELAAQTAALNKAAAPHVLELESLEAEAKKLALDHGELIFGEDRRSLTENGFCLAIRETAAVVCEDEDSAIHMLRKDATDPRLDDGQQLACNACLRIEVTLDKSYILKHYDTAPRWFETYGLSVADKTSASLKPAPKPRARKATKLKTAQAPVESEAA